MPFSFYNLQIAALPESAFSFTFDISLKNFFFNVYLFLREREGQRQSMSRGGTEGEGDRIRSRLQALSYSTDPMRGLNSQTTR